MILNGSKERRSRQNYFFPVVAMKEESGGHFPLPMERRNSEITETIGALAKKIFTKSPEDAYLSF